MSFVRRFSSMPTPDVISQIEGIVIVDQPVPTTFSGVSTGVVGMVGEFADMKYAVQVANGVVSEKCQPVEIFSPADLLDKVGGFDSTIGDFGGDDGNGYTALLNKPFSRLVVAPVNLASPEAVRLYRELPGNDSNGYPIVPMAAATVPAGTQFQTDGGARVKLGTSVTFTADGAIAFGTDGVTTAGSGPTVTFTSATGDFINKGVKIGDALVVNVPAVDDGGTYRITSITDSTTLKVQALDGTASTWTGVTLAKWRVHPASSFDSGGNVVAANVAGFTLPARPIDSSILALITLSPTVAAPVGTATAWNPLSGLKMRTQPSAGLTFGNFVQSINQATTTPLEVLYKSALNALLADAAPMADVSIVFSARTSDDIRVALKTHAQQASAYGKGRMAIIAPPVSMVSQTTAISASDPGVGANRDERVIYCWPGVKTQVNEAQNIRVKLANNSYATDGLLDVRADGFMASILSNLASERNPGQSAAPVPTCLAGIKGFQSGTLPSFKMSDYIIFKQYGIAALRQDRSSGWQFQSGITSSITSGQRNINRRRMADEIQDSLAALYEKFSKLPLTTALKDQIDAETVAYMTGLLSPQNPAAQRIEGYLVDSKSGNTPQLNAAGIYVVVTKVRMLGIADDIVIQSEVGPTVNVTAA